MIPLLVWSLVVMLAWSLVARRLAGWHVSGPLVMVAGGMVVGLAAGEGIAEQLDTHIAERLVELVLAVLLFVDALVVRDGFLAGERGAVGRLLFGALPLSLVAAFAVGLPLLPTSSWAVVFAIGCVVMPLDFASAPHLLKDRQLPRRVRHVLAVESGYNDGLFSPAFAYALLLIGAEGHGDSVATTLGKAVPSAFWAVLVGVGIGGATGWGLRRTERRRWTDHEAVGIAALLLPIVTYALAVKLEGNGFVAAFLAGIAYRQARTGGWLGWGRRLGRRLGAGRAKAAAPAPASGPAGGGPERIPSPIPIPEAEFVAVETLGTVAALVMWFVFGAVAVIVFQDGLPASVLVYGAVVLTLARVVPVWLAMTGTRAPALDRLLLGLVGPRGTTSIVFGLLAFNAIGEDADAALALSTMTVVLLGSLLLHGVAVPLAARRLPAAAGAGDDEA